MSTMIFRMDQPEEIVKKMVYGLPEYLFISDNSTFFDPAMGKGDYLVMVARRLKEHGHSKENILSRLYGFETNELYLENCRYRTPIGKANISKRSYEDITQINFYLEEDMPNRFDCIIMNPPFNDSTTSGRREQDARRSKNQYLHVKFISFAMKHADHIMVICPIQEWFNGKGSKERTELLSNHRLRSVEKISAANAKKIFKVTTGDLGIMHITATPNDFTRVSVDGKDVGNQPSDRPIIFAQDAEWVALLNKLTLHPSIVKRMEVSTGPNRTNAKNFYCEEGPCSFVETMGEKGKPLCFEKISDQILNQSSPMYNTKSKRYVIDKNVDYVRVGINQAGLRRKLSTLKIIPAGVHTSYSVQTLACYNEKDSLTEARNMIHYLGLKLPTAIIYHTHFSSANGKTTFKFVPDMDFTKLWTDEELYKHFNLTEEEIKLIEETISGQ